MMSKQEKDLRGTVTKSNLLVLRSKYQLSNNQDRVLRYIISQLPVLDTDFIESVEKDADIGDYRRTPVVNISVKDYQELLDITDAGLNYNRIKTSIHALESKKVWIEDPNKSGGEITAGWIMRSKIDKGSGDIRIVIDPYILRYIRGLKTKFVSYKVENSVRMKSIYSRMLYDVILTESWKDGDEHIITVSDLRKYFQLSDGEYSRFHNFRVRCVDPSVADINKYTNLTVTCDYVMSGRTCRAIRFTVKGAEKQKKTGKRVDFTSPNCSYECDGQESMDLNAMDPDKKPKKSRKPRQNKNIHNFAERQTDYDSIVNQRVLERMNIPKS